jgi:hypothetical protein
MASPEIITARYSQESQLPASVDDESRKIVINEKRENPA